MLEEVVAIAEEIAEIDCCFVFCFLFYGRLLFCFSLVFFTVGFFLCFFFFLSNSCDFLLMIFRF